MEKTELKYIVIKCPHCGRVKKYGKWIRPLDKDLRDIKEHYNEIEFVNEICSHCDRFKKEG